jgi:hypothetical protein
MDMSLPHSSIVGHGGMVIKHVKSAHSMQFCEHFQQNSCMLAISILMVMSMRKTQMGSVVLYNESTIINIIIFILHE